MRLVCENSGIIREARTGRPPVIRQPNPPSRANSQTGIARGRSNTAVGQVDLAVRARTPATTIVQVGRSTSRSQAPPMAPVAPHQRSSSMARRQSTGCTIPDCNDPECQSTRNTERRYVLQRPAAIPIQPSASTQSHPSLHSQPTVPSVPGATPRPRAHSFVATRPQSWAGIPYFSTYATPVPVSTPAPRGPPPSPSAYRNTQIPYQYPTYQPHAPYAAQSTYGHSASYMAPTQPHLSSPSETPFVPIFNPPPAPVVQPQVKEMYNARISLHGTQPTSVPREHQRLTRHGSISARVSTQPMPGSFPDDEDALSDSSMSDYYEDRYSPRKRDSKVMMPPPAPPSRPAQIMARPSARIPAHPAPHSSTSSSHSRSNSYVDSDRTPRQSDIRRQSSTTSSRSRHHSVSTSASSRRTPATTVSTESRVEYVTAEDQYGNRQQYSAEDYARLKRYEAQQKIKAQQTADAESYQYAINGSPDQLTLDNIRQMTDAPSAPRSRVSARSRRSAQSGTPSEGIKISYGETTMQVTGDARFKISHDVEGGPHLVISPGTGKEKSYYTETSKSSESRIDRSRLVDRDPGRRRRRSVLEGSAI
ncbi:hypothetical protein AMS68_001602 [Peltaster fructicola]|uniref:Uncharacterized protein n=1 Tax=Peltaster fructicola TaxID=286661 RepID=A0A6H0XN72_9PEZI|nr:hypothetical protein AMS68_001602 [Peltaster fructicola]